MFWTGIRIRKYTSKDRIPPWKQKLLHNKKQLLFSQLDLPSLRSLHEVSEHLLKDVLGFSISPQSCLRCKGFVAGVLKCNRNHPVSKATGEKTDNGLVGWPSQWVVPGDWCRKCYTRTHPFVVLSCGDTLGLYYLIYWCWRNKEKQMEFFILI